MTRLQTNARRLVRLKQASEYLSISCWTLRQIIQAGEIPIVKVRDGAPWLLDLSDLDSWVDQHKHTIE
ncbi:MAG: helix-turn-helix domain-containing protein [Candidatus Sulfotelmatobacter sp.]|jgi:excisionase family DNA binding protein